METNAFSTDAKANFGHEVILSRWFYVSAGLNYLPVKPKSFFARGGFPLKGKPVNSILSTCDGYEMRATDADAVLSEYILLPDHEKLRKLFDQTAKPVFVLLRHRLTPKSKLAGVAKKLETLGAAGIFTGHHFPVDELKNICNLVSIPVIALTNPDFVEIAAKINAGAFAVCLTGQNISKNLIDNLRKSFPGKSIIAACDRTEGLMSKCLEYGVDAILFKPCVPFKMDWEE